MAANQKRALQVFLCHSSDDKPIVRDLYQRLNAEGWIDAWIDEEKLYPGQDWEYEIEKALDNADVVIVTLSTSSVSKEGYVQKELRFVLDMALEKPQGTIFVLPVRLDHCAWPRKLRSIQGVDFFPPENLESAYGRLRQSLMMRANALGINITSIQAKFELEQQSSIEPKLELSEDASIGLDYAGLIKIALDMDILSRIPVLIRLDDIELKEINIPCAKEADRLSPPSKGEAFSIRATLGAHKIEVITEVLKAVLASKNFIVEISKSTTITVSFLASTWEIDVN